MGGLFYFIVVVVWYATDARFYDFAEPTIPAVASMWLQGHALYPELTAADRYAHIYGPMAFIPHAVAFHLAGSSILASKCVGAAAGAGSVGFVYLTLRKDVCRTAAAVCAGYYCLGVLVFRNAGFWTRPDSLQLLCISGALWATTTLAGRNAAVVLGVFSGLLWNMKITGPLYSLVPFAILYYRSAFWYPAAAACGAALLAVAPFLDTRISAQNYFSWIASSASTGFVGPLFRQNVEWALFMLSPIVLVHGAYRAIPAQSTQSRWCDIFQRSVRGNYVALLSGMAVVTMAASKPGAGAYHLMGFLPIVTQLTVAQAARPRWSDRFQVAIAAVAAVAVLVLIVVAQQWSFITSVLELRGTETAADIRKFEAEHRGATIEVGYAANERLTFSRPIAVFLTGVYLLDQPAIQEHQLQGMTIPDATISAIADCHVWFWLMPKGEEPFTAGNRYPAMRGAKLYSEEFRQTFFETYRLSGHTSFFDVWECGERPAAAAHR